ncbi:hypothetical protein MSAN_00316600 [Mycena sanguinolenta]|uniref:Uncharacterized protein n=1 Tax=Mycena sanguinolenta TaxID=230812 RepID=A0A8H6ZET7_9AGAR|nr:hypothetical protein MSAN_00316600 [Mycena sanguinolenta]
MRHQPPDVHRTATISIPPQRKLSRTAFIDSAPATISTTPPASPDNADAMNSGSGSFQTTSCPRSAPMKNVGPGSRPCTGARCELDWEDYVSRLVMRFNRNRDLRGLCTVLIPTNKQHHPVQLRDIYYQQIRLRRLIIALHVAAADRYVDKKAHD